MARKKSGGGGGAPEWLVTFADLMSLLVCFFVLIISFSNQDEKKLQIVAGSMRDAFGTQTEIRGAGMVERDGLPANPRFRETTRQPTPDATNSQNDREAETLSRQGPENATHEVELRRSERRRNFTMAMASLRQALQDLPDIAELSKNIVLHTDEDGLHIELTDADGRAMFASSSAQLYPVARDILVRVAPVLRQMPNRIMVTGHTSYRPGSTDPGGGWELSADRADAVRQVLMAEGIGNARFAGIVGKADTEPLFANDPTLAANRRVTILLMDEEPPLPPEFRP
jgi:chemotaxis protein MotB